MTGPDPASVSVLIPAAGRGDRLGLGPKALLQLAGRPVIDWVVDKARQLGAEVLVGCAPGMAAPPGTVRVEGGSSRQQTVDRLAQQASRPWSLVWNAASPFASLALARSVLAATTETGAAAPCLAGQVPWYVVEQGRIASAHPGAFAGASQAPEAYATVLLQAASARGQREGWELQGTVQLLLRAGHAVATVPGEKLNLKLTTPEDWVLAQALLHRLSS